MIFLNKYPTVKLDNGKRVVNYSSPRPYTFHTGEVLEASKNREDKLFIEELNFLAELDKVDIILVSSHILWNIRGMDDLDNKVKLLSKLRHVCWYNKNNRIIKSNKFVACG